MRDFKSFDLALVTPAVNVGTSSGYDSLPLMNAISFGKQGGYLQKFSKLFFIISFSF